MQSGFDWRECPVSFRGMSSDARRSPQYWVKAPGARDAYGPVGSGRIATLIAAGIVAKSSWISDGDTDFSPVGDLSPEALGISKPESSEAPCVRRSGVPESGETGAENRFAVGYETDDVLRFNRSLEKEPDLKLPPIWREPRMKDKLRFVGVMMPVTAIFAYGLLRMKESGGMQYAPMATVAWMVSAGLVWFVVFVLTPTRPGI